MQSAGGRSSVSSVVFPPSCVSFAFADFLERFFFFFLDAPDWSSGTAIGEGDEERDESEDGGVGGRTVVFMPLHSPCTSHIGNRSSSGKVVGTGMSVEFKSSNMSEGVHPTGKRTLILDSQSGFTKAEM